MVRFWCPWCGSVAISPTRDDIVPCGRCTLEFWRLFNYFPRTDMVPLEPGEKLRQPANATKGFTFVNVETGEVLGATERSPSPAPRRQPPRTRVV